jgi:hypothetical protein
MLMHHNQKMLEPPSSQASYIWQWLVPRDMVLGLKISWEHYHYMVYQGPNSWSLLKFNMLVFWLLWLCISNRYSACYMWSTLLWTFTSNMTWFSTIQTKIICMSMLLLLLHEGLESCLTNLHGIVFWWGCRKLG